MSDICVKEEEVSKEEPKLNDADELYALGMRFSTGREVDHDLIVAHKWFNLAAMMGHEGALSARAELAREMTSEQIADAQRQARAWLWSRKEAPAEEPKAKTEKPAIVRPLYVRRKAEAMRSAKSYARVVA